LLFLLSLLVIVVVLNFAMGHSLPFLVTDALEKYLDNDGSSTAQYVALGFGLGMLASLSPLRLVLRYFSTVVHELGHAFMAGALFARPKSIRIQPSSSGLAIYELSPNWGRFRASLVSAAGYPAPSIAAVAAVQAVQMGRSVAWAIFSVAVLSLAIILLIRNVWGIIWTSAVVGGCYFAFDKISSDVVGGIVAGVAGFLVINGIQFAWIQVTLVRKAPGSGVDAESIALFTKLPAKVVVVGHLLVCLGLGYRAGYLAIYPYWNEISNWLTKLY
jgi:hypothetical protein